MQITREVLRQMGFIRIDKWAWEKKIRGVELVFEEIDEDGGTWEFMDCTIHTLEEALAVAYLSGVEKGKQ